MQGALWRDGVIEVLGVRLSAFRCGCVEVGMAVVSIVVAVSVICLDTFKRELWERFGPLHRLDCECRGLRLCCKMSYAGTSFEIGRARDAYEMRM